MDVQASNEAGTGVWKSSYKSQELYGLEDASPESMLKLSERLHTDDSLWSEFQRVYSNGGEDNSPKRKTAVCMAKYGLPSQIKQCKKTYK